MNETPEREIFEVDIDRKQRAMLEALGRKTGIPVELAILIAIQRYVKKKLGEHWLDQ